MAFGLFCWITGVSGLVRVLLGLRKRRGPLKEWQEFAVKLSGRVFIVSFVLAMFIAPYLQYRDKVAPPSPVQKLDVNVADLEGRKRTESIEKELEQKKATTQELRQKIDTLEKRIEAVPQPKPLESRRKALLDKIDKRILPALATQDVRCTARVNMQVMDELRELEAEPGAAQYFTITRSKNVASVEMLGVTAQATYDITLNISKRLVAN